MQSKDEFFKDGFDTLEKLLINYSNMGSERNKLDDFTQDLKTKLVSDLNDIANKMIIGSLYQTKVNCGIKTCKKCMNNEKGHLATHLGYQTSGRKHRTTYISKDLVNKLKKGNQFYKQAKKLLMDIGELNLLIFKTTE